jgi:hypothetical protein
MADGSEWARRILADIPANFYGRVELEFRAGQVHKVVRTETFISPERDQSYQKSIDGAEPIIRAHDFTAK